MNSKRSKKEKIYTIMTQQLPDLNSIALYGSHMSGCHDIAQFHYLLSQRLHLNERQRKRFSPPNKTFRKTGIHVQAFSWEKK